MSEDANKPAVGFVSLKSVTKGAPKPEAALAEIRHIYFRTTRQTIENDLAHAIELLKTLPTEDDREKATVYMEGLAQMRKEWAGKKKTAATATRTRGRKSKPAGPKPEG